MFTFKPYVESCFQRAVGYRRQSVCIAAWGAALFASLGLGNFSGLGPLLGIPPIVDWLSALGLSLVSLCLVVDLRAAQAEHARQDQDPPAPSA